MSQKKSSSGAMGVSQLLKMAPLPGKGSQGLPRASAPDLGGLEVQVPSVPGPTEDDVLRRFYELKREVCPRRVRTMGEAVARGDELRVDLLWLMRGTVVPFSFRKDERLVLTELPHLPGFAEVVTGQPVGSKLFIGLVLPETYPEPRLRRAKIEVLVDINAASELTPLKDDSPELLKRLDRGKSLTEVMASIRAELIDEAAAEQVSEGQRLVLLKLVERAGPIALTDAQIDTEVRLAWQRIEGHKMKEKKLDPDTVQSAREGWLRDPATRAEAEERLKVSLVLAAIAERDQISVGEANLKELLMRLAPGLTETAAHEALNETMDVTASLAEYGLYLLTVEHVLSKATLKFEGGTDVPSR